MKKISKLLVFAIFAFLLITVYSCTNSSGYTVRNEGNCAEDSTKLIISDTIISLHIGDVINPLSLRTQIAADTIITYMICDNNCIYSFNLEQDSLIGAVPLDKCGRINNYSGFSYMNRDSIFVYNYANSELFIITDNGDIVNRFSLAPYIRDISPEALVTSPILIADNIVILSGIPLSPKSRMTKYDPISVAIDMTSGNIRLGGNFSDEYSKGYFGGVYYNAISHCIDSTNNLIYSFPASNYIYRFNSNLEFIDSLYMGSRYTKSIQSTEEPSIKLMKNKDERLKYYTSQDSYHRIMYDPYRNLYHRIAMHKATSETGTPKPFSIISMTIDGRIINETPIFTDQNLISSNAHVHPNGILIQKKSPDENLVNFTVLNIPN